MALADLAEEGRGEVGRGEVDRCDLQAKEGRRRSLALCERRQPKILTKCDEVGLLLGGERFSKARVAAKVLLEDRICGGRGWSGWQLVGRLWCEC